MSSRMRRLGTVAAVSAIFVGSAAVPAVALAAPTPFIAKLNAVPNPPGAPQPDTFLITVPHSRKAPQHVVFRFTNQSGQTTTTSEPLKKLNKYQYQVIWPAKERGHVRVQVYTANRQLMVQANYPVAKAKVNVTGRVLVGAMFIGAAVWMWWRQRRWNPKP